VAWYVLREYPAGKGRDGEQLHRASAYGPIESRDDAIVLTTLNDPHWKHEARSPRIAEWSDDILDSLLEAPDEHLGYVDLKVRPPSGLKKHELFAGRTRKEAMTQIRTWSELWW
jgi:hypothetical protein